jgi:hypothetical protein
MAQWARAVEAWFMPRVSALQFTVAVALITMLVALITLVCVRLAPLW